jgi:hypothetical protein
MLLRTIKTPVTTSSLAALSLLFMACGSSGLYNFARTYEPLKAERSHMEASETQASFEDVKRDPNGFKNKEVGWFGVVTSFSDIEGGGQRLGLSLRAHQPRHLCADNREASCRVTVSEKSLGNFTVDIKLAPEELNGKDRVWIGSLLKVYGTPTGEYDEEGAVVLKATYHRHFPRGTYVTTANRDSMRR